MSNVVLSKSVRYVRTVIAGSSLFYPGLYISRAASVSRAIDRGIRRSKGIGFRGKEKTQAEPPNHGTHGSPVRRTADPPPAVFAHSKLTKNAWKASAKKTPIPPKKPDLFSKALRRGRFGEVIGSQGSAKIRIGKRVLGGGEERSRAWSNDQDSGYDTPSSMRRETSRQARPYREARLDRDNGRRFIEQGDNRSDNSRAVSDRPHWDRRGKSRSYDPEPPNRSSSVAAYPSLAASYQSTSQDTNRNKSASGGNNCRDSGRGRDYTPQDSNRGRKLSDGIFPQGNDRERDYTSQASNTGRNSNDGKFHEEVSRARDTEFNARFAPATKENENGFNPTRVAKFNDKRMPISIPYTTPASEFLYGTSVVEAALISKNIPRRKHYKLYIYSGEKRENVARDADLARLARRSGVEVARVGADWLPLMDKMSGSRPHNGYILEASPLPRLPVTSLGQLAEQDDNTGFKVAVDYQSREDAAVNGTSNFIKVKRSSGRKPLVLFLDSILDPGNLGGIIRTASFLGATAVAISKNCTPFSPVVLKASAGASENITLFTVNKPAGFIAESKLAGWKIYAAVAPSGSNMASLISTDDLADPLSDDPCILMLGAEGEGLRMNLRSKADAQLSIRSNGQSHGVDSLNVSVATGILCSAFLKRSSPRKSAAPIREISSIDKHDDGTRELF